MAAVQGAEFVALSEVASKRGMPAKTLLRRVRRYGIPLFTDPMDLRRVLLRTEDVASIFEPKPILGDEAAAAA